MRLFSYELRKILSGAALWVFVGLCVVFNMWAMPMNKNKEFDTVTPFYENVFDGYNTSELAEIYIYEYGLTGRVAESMRAKFNALQLPADQRAVNGDSYSPYFGEHTYVMHQQLFHETAIAGVMGRLLLQGLLLAVLLALLGVSYEQMNRTEHSVYATKTGRKVLRYKNAANLTAGIGLYALLTLITLAVYFSIHDYGNVWDSSVSSGFNYINDFFTGSRPFITWQSFTVRSFLFANIGVSLGVVICFSLMGTTVGTLSKNGYIGFFVIVLINAVCLTLSIVFSVNSFMRYVLHHTPIWLWVYNGLWFTDGTSITLWKNFELWGIGVSLLLLTALCALVAKNFERRDIV